MAEIVRLANFGPKDTVYEIGAGKGIITRELAKATGKVTAIEIDPQLCRRLRADFIENTKVKIINADWLDYRVPEKNYKVFANIPFNLTAEILRKLLADRKLAEAYLVVQKEAAEKFTGQPRSTQFSVLNQPWFEFGIIRQFRKTDFIPEPSVDTVLLKIIKRQKTPVDQTAKDAYSRFVQLGFNRWRANFGKNFKDIFTYNQWRRLAKDLKFPVKALPSDLTFSQWLGIFKFFKTTK